MISRIRNRVHPLWRLRRTAWFRALQRHLDLAVTAQALAGARRILKKVRPVIFIEFFEPTKMAVFNEFAYRVYDLQEGSNWLAIPEEQVERARREMPDLQNLASR